MKLNEDILLRYLTDACTAEEREEVNRQIGLDDSLKEEYDTLAQIWDKSNDLRYDESLTSSSWLEFKANVKAPVRVKGFDWLKLAASIILLAAFSFSIYYFTNTGDSYMAKEHSMALQLVDQSSVTINDHSVLLLNKDFNNTNRLSELKGEAYFDVAHSGRSFVVEVGKAQITVTGTRFNVLNAPESNFLSVELYEGEVVITLDQTDHVLKPGDKFEFSNGEISLLKVNHSLPLWLSDTEIVCKNESLEFIMIQLQRHYGVNFDLPRKMLKERYTMSLPKENLQRCLDIIEEISGADLKLENNTISTQ